METIKESVYRFLRDYEKKMGQKNLTFPNGDLYTQYPIIRKGHIRHASEI